ncbi:ribonuclease H1 domain-containing protein [Natronoflexus pectinivorans]|uniref:Ribonuclease H n=1 Tax=Natronoflexus pectinivorans TaxID=682526 RepID=A0A4R2GKL1_9BACT|nr:ribonuclease H family protein [Natronoflexus pectinivorans]TCO07929.1 ribonuclease HI [Natronoflexus pectinivorans]
MPAQKFYVVWKGRKPGIYRSWDECRQQTDGFEGARYKSYKTEEEAKVAYKQPSHIVFQGAGKKKFTSSSISNNTSIIKNSLSVDAACSGNPGKMEYRGVHVGSGEEWFLMQFDLGTNNIGEFLAIVHGLAELKRRRLNIPVYTDSMTALSWVKKKKCGSKLPDNASTKQLFELVRRAEKWLQENTWEQPLLKWDTEKWGEIPADFGRK